MRCVRSCYRRHRRRRRRRHKPSPTRALLQDFGEAFKGHDQIYGVDLQGRPVVLSCFGTMDVEDVFGDANRFLRWRVQVTRDT